MHKSVKRKIFTYVQSGQVMKLKHYLESCLKKCPDFNLDFTTGSMSRTPLHMACLLGDDAIVRCLLHYNANAELLDRDGNTPVHLAAKQAGEEQNYANHKLLINPLLKNFPNSISMVNKWNETPSTLLQEAKKKHKSFLEADATSWAEEFGNAYKNGEGLDYHVTHALSNEAWNEKLANEWADDCADAGHTSKFTNDEDYDNIVPDYPTFEQWADRIAAEYKRKNLSESEKLKQRKEENRKRKEADSKQSTDRLEREREKYRKMISQRKTERLESKHKDYKEKLSKHMSEKTSKLKLRFKDIPWPCLGTVKEMVEVIMSGYSDEGDQKDRRKYVLKQQILWHPDKFMQRCKDTLAPEDKDSILDTVKLLSQSLNELLKRNSE